MLIKLQGTDSGGGAQFRLSGKPTCVLNSLLRTDCSIQTSKQALIIF